MILEAIFKDRFILSLQEGNSLFFIIFFFVFFSWIFLKANIYFHQKFSITIIYTCLIIIFIVNETKSNVLDIKERLLGMAYYCGVFLCYGLFDVLGKRYFNVHMDSPYHLMFFIGGVSLLILCPYELFLYFLDKSYTGIIKKIIYLCSIYKGYYILLFLGDLATTFIWFSGIWLTIYYWSPCHFICGEIFVQLLGSFFNWDSQMNVSYQVTYILLYIVMIICACIYNEIFVIKLCGLEVNTKKEIILRQKIESDLKYFQPLKDDYTDSEKSDDEEKEDNEEKEIPAPTPSINNENN